MHFKCAFCPDGSRISIDFTAVENEVADNRFQRSELDYMIYNDPLAYYIIVFCELIPRTDTEDIRNPLLSSLRKAQSAGPHC